MPVPIRLCLETASFVLDGRRRGEAPPSVKSGVLAVVAVASLALLGCGPSNPLGRESISGSVTFQGESLANGAIGFDPVEDGGVNSGAPIENGRYEIEAHRGLPPGKYRVRINASQSDAAAVAALPPGAPEPPGIELIPPQYNVNSDKVIEVTAAGTNTFDFTISP